MNAINQACPEDIDICRYIALSISHAEAIKNGNSFKSNFFYKDLQFVLNKIIHSGNREKLVPLLNHINPAVRSNAAFHTYVLDAPRSTAVLEEVAVCPVFIGFCAEMILKQIRNGELKPN